MDSFKKVKTGITSLKKEREELKRNHEFLSEKLASAVESNAAVIGELQKKSSSFQSGISSLDTGLEKTSKQLDDSLKKISSDIDALRERTGDHQKALVELGERLGSVSEKTQEASKERQENTKSLSSLGSRVDELGGGIKQVSSDVSAVRNEVSANASALKKHDTASEKMTLGLQSLRKDISSVNERIRRVKESSVSNSKKLELLGTLENKIKNIEDIKNRLVESVETMNQMKSGVASLKQKTGDLEKRLTDSDRNIESKLLEKTKVLDSRLSEKSDSLEKQINDRLKFLDSSIDGKSKALEAKINQRNTQFEDRVSGSISALQKSAEREAAELRKLRADLSKKSTELKKLTAASAAAKTGSASMKKELSEKIRQLKSEMLKDAESISNITLELSGMEKEIYAANAMIKSLRGDSQELRKRVDDLDVLRERIKDVENLESTLSAKIKELRPLEQNLSDVRKEMEKTKIEIENADSVLESKLDYNISNLKKEHALSSATLTRLDEDMKKAMLDLTSLKKDIKTVSSESSGREEELGSRIDNVAAETGRAVQSALSETGDIKKSLEKVSLDLTTLRKDGTARKNSMEKLKTDVSGLRKKADTLEKRQIKLQDMDDANSALGQAMDRRLDEKIKVIESMISESGKRAESLISEKAGAVRKETGSGISDLRRQLQAKSRSIESLKKKVSAIEKLEERLKTVDADKDDIAKSVASLEKMRENMRDLENRAGNLDKYLSEMKGEVSGELSQIKTKIEAAEKEKRDKFGSAVKAFLNARTELNNKMGLVDLKLSETQKRVEGFATMQQRVDLLERKMERLTERDSQVRKDVDNLEKKSKDDGKVMLVDLDGQGRSSVREITTEDLEVE